MRVAAVGDVHGEEHLEALRACVADGPEVDLLLLAGDLTHRNDLDVFGRVLDVLQEAVDVPTAAVFGNHEWSDSHAAYRERFDVAFLQDEAATFSRGSETVRVVGSTGVLDRPTWWQRTHLPDIHRVYTERVRVLDGLLAGEGTRILLTHYAPTFRTLVGEGEDYWDQLGSQRMERVLLRRRPELVIHGHAHRGVPSAELTTPQATLEDFGRARAIPVHNVAFPVRGDLTVVELPTEEGLRAPSR